MSVVQPNECWQAALKPSDLKLMDEDGSKARLFGPDNAELAIIGPRRPQGTLVLPIGFATLDQANRAAKVIDLALESLRRIADEVIDQETCHHDYGLERFSRVLGKEAICYRCGYLPSLPSTGTAA